MAVDDQDHERRDQQHPQQRQLVRRRQRGHRCERLRRDRRLSRSTASIASAPVTGRDGWKASSGPSCSTPDADRHRRGRIREVGRREIAEARTRAALPRFGRRRLARPRSARAAAQRPARDRRGGRAARLERVVRERLHHAGARDGHDPGLAPSCSATSVMSPRRRAASSAAAGRAGSPMSAARSARVICGAAFDRAILRRQPRELDPRAHRVELRRDRPRSARAPSGVRTPAAAAVEIAARSRGSRRSATSDSASVGSSVDGLAEMLERASSRRLPARSTAASSR